MELISDLGHIRSFLAVQMGKEEETMITQDLSRIMNNCVFYQHPNLMRALDMHTTVMDIMVNVLGNLFYFQIFEYNVIGYIINFQKIFGRLCFKIQNFEIQR